jgi:hypothetical protein
MARVYWVTQDELYLATEAGVRLVFQNGDPEPPSSWLADVLRVRLIVGDPVCGTLIYVPALPGSALEGVCCTTGNGQYYLMRDGEWEALTVQFGDEVIGEYRRRAKSIWQAAHTVIKALLIRINPLDYITGGNAGAQSVSFPSLADVTAFFNERLKHITDMMNDADGYNRVRVARQPVGGLYD